jgi:hypothetical protein
VVGDTHVIDMGRMDESMATTLLTLGRARRHVEAASLCLAIASTLQLHSQPACAQDVDDGEQSASDDAQGAATAEAESNLKLDVGGGLTILYVQPIEDPDKNKVEVFEARLRLDAEFDRFGLHLVPVFRDDRERGFHVGPSWVQEGYIFAKLEPVTLKIGKVYAQFGRFWDNSFVGNAHEYDGLKLDPNNGISVEGSLAPAARLGLVFFAQYFVVDGVANYSLPGRDTVSIPGARRRNQLVGRVEPFMKVGDLTTLKLGLSGAFFYADIPALPEKQKVGRLAIDATVMVERFLAFGEYTKQFGRHVTDFPFPGTPATDTMAATLGRSANRIDYLLFGGEYTYDRFTLRFTFNQGNYKTVSYKENRYIPAVAVSIHEYLFALVEWAVLNTTTDGTSHELLLTIHGNV